MSSATAGARQLAMMTEHTRIGVTVWSAKIALRSTVPQVSGQWSCAPDICEWLRAVRYIDHLAGTNTHVTPTRSRREEAVRDRAINALKSQLPAEYLVGRADQNKPAVVAAAAIAYITTELGGGNAAPQGQGTGASLNPTTSPHDVVDLTADDDMSEGGTDGLDEADPNDKLIGEAVNMSELDVMIELRSSIKRYKKIEVDLSNLDGVERITEEMIAELSKGAQGISTFGARGDGDFESMAVAVYTLRTYFIDDVDDDSSITNLVQLANLAVDLIKDLKAALTVLKEVLGADAVPLPTAIQAVAREVMPKDTRTSTEASGRVKNSFAFCNTTSLKQQRSLSAWGAADNWMNGPACPSKGIAI